MNAIQTPLMARLVPVALVSLGLLMASPAGAASMTESERCNWKADKVENRYSKCLSRSTTRLSNVLNGSTLNEDFHCAEQFYRSMDVIERRATFKDVGAECEARLTPESQACTQAAALIVAGRDLGDYGSQFDDLSLEDLACSPIQAYLQDSYDDGYDAGYDTGYDVGYDTGYDAGYDEGEASVDVASNDQSVYDDGYDAGYDTGYDVGYDEGEASCEARVEALEESVCNLSDGSWDATTSMCSLPRFVACADGLTVADMETGLLWERKTNDSGLHDVDNTYSWSSSGTAFDGTATTVFLEGLNNAAFAGHADWRLPYISELQSITVGSGVETSSSNVSPPDPAMGTNPTGQSTVCPSQPCIDSDFALVGGPTASSVYWSASSGGANPARDGAWVASLSNGVVAGHNNKARDRFVRAVRAGSCGL